MRFLLPTGGEMGNHYGVLVSPGSYGIPDGIKKGYPWAADNQAFTNGFNPSLFFPWLDSLLPYRNACLFVAVPDVVSDPIQTGANYRHWLRWFEGWPAAFVAQDGQEDLPLPDYYDALFIGGSTAWKESAGAIECIRRAQRGGKHIHVGRVNWRRRYNLFRVLDGSDNFTCDGTRTRYDGKDRALAAWAGYMAQPPLITI